MTSEVRNFNQRQYVIVWDFTDQGIRNVKNSIKRAEKFKGAVEAAGGKLISEYYTLGKYDIVTIVEAPNDEVIMAVLLATGRLGNVRSETLKAFPMCEAANIIERLQLQKGKQIFTPCKIHPHTQYIYLESIEHHCKYKSFSTFYFPFLTRLFAAFCLAIICYLRSGKLSWE